MIARELSGKLVRLRTADIDDADFTLSLRKDASNTRHMPKLDVSLENQEKWIESQRVCDDSIFFVIERLDGEKIGTFSVYNIKDGTAETGRLIMLGSQIESIEMYLLFHDFVYKELGIKNLYSEIEADNHPAIGLAGRLGGSESERRINPKTGKEEILMTGTLETYEAKRDKLVKLLDRFAER